MANEVLANSVEARTPGQTDAAIQQSLPRPVAALLAADGTMGAVETHLAAWGMDGLDLTTAREMLAASSRPANRQTLIREITKMRLVTKAREGAAEELELANEAMIEALREWPADVAVASLREMARSSTFTPSLAEILQCCRENGLWRRNLARGLDRLAKTI